MAQPEKQPSLDNRSVEDLTLAMPGANGPLSVPEVTQYRPQGSQSWRWLLIALTSCFAAGGAAVGAFVWLIHLPPTTNCDNPTTVTTDRAQLYCAQVAAETGELDDVLASLQLVGSWTSSHPLYYEVQPLIERWSWIALREAEQKFQDSDLEGATALVDQIPPSSPVYATAQDSLGAWNAEWEQGHGIWTEAQTALENQDWATASRQVIALSELNSRHWRTRQVQELSRQIYQERQARRQLQEAVQLASPGGADQLGLALRAASRIDDSTYAYQAAQSYMDRWGDWLLKLGLDKWYASQLEAAIRLGRDAALNPSRAKAAQELIWLSQSRQLAQRSLGHWRTSPDQLMRLYRAMLVANQIPQDSPYFPQAQSGVATWRTHLDGLSHLQVAQVAGRVQSLDTLKSAIDQAAKVPLGSPRRIQAQTLMAHWQQEVQRLEDRPYLVKAHQLAQTDTIDGLMQAVDVASQIGVSRALRNEAQSWIYVWQNQIEVLEDRPILNQARALADDGQFSQAMATASAIKPGRALFDQAQVAIAGWQRQIDAIERARQRALQRAAARRAAANAAAAPEPSFPADDVSGSAGASPTAGGDNRLPQEQPSAPAPIQTRPQRNPLPTRIETIPGDRTMPEPGQPTEPAVPQPAVAEPSPASAKPPTALDESVTAPQPITPPAPQPVPVEQSAPDSAPTFPDPIPPAPAPQLPVISPPAASPQNDATAPAPVPAPAASEAAVPTQPSVSTAPVPEQAVSVKTAKDVTVLYTGSLYAGR